MYTVTLPGLLETDVLEIEDSAYDKEFVCPLTIHTAGQCNTRDFLIEKHALNTVGLSDKEQNGVLQLLQQGLSCEDMGTATFHTCRHTFATMPLLYNIVSNQFRCPICRGGSNTEVDLSQLACALPLDIWKILCQIGSDVKLRNKLERDTEDEIRMLEEQAPEGDNSIFEDMELPDILEIVSFRAIFSIYRDSAHTQDNTRVQTPVSVVVIDMQCKPNFLDADSSDAVIFIAGQWSCVCVVLCCVVFGVCVCVVLCCVVLCLVFVFVLCLCVWESLCLHCITRQHRTSVR